MNTDEFRVHAKTMVDYIGNYMDKIDERNVAPTLDPGYLKKLIPSKLKKNKCLKIINFLATFNILRH